MSARWLPERAAEWMSGGWTVGCNYHPASAVNWIEMWRADTFDPEAIDRELELAQGLGMNAIRVFLHHLVWEEDAEGLIDRFGTLLGIADRHGMRVMPVLFDSVMSPNATPGAQPEPVPGVFVSAWVHGPGRERLEDESRWPLLEEYARGMVRAFRADERILAWDVWNEPVPHPGELYPGYDAWLARRGWVDSPRKAELTLELVTRVFEWVRGESPTQPLTSPVYDFWPHRWNPEERSEMERVQIEGSDVLSFHSYSGPEIFRRQAEVMLAYRRPVLCTEYGGRPHSFIEEVLPVGHELGVGMFNWGLVEGRMQTKYPFASWETPYGDREPEMWYHDLFHADGTPYRVAETNLIRQLGSRVRLRD